MSDQDFFFDEEDAKTAAKPGKGAAKTDKAPSTKSTAGAARSASVATTASTPVFERSVTMTVTALLMAIALLIGVILGFLLGGSTTPTPVTDSNQILAPTGAPGALSEDQLSQPLPSGHPAVGATSGSTPATTGK